MMPITPPRTNSDTDLQEYMDLLPLYPSLGSLYLPSSSSVSSTATLQYDKSESDVVADDFYNYLSYNNEMQSSPVSSLSTSTSNDKLQIRILGVPNSGAKSRVETQIKLCIQLMTDNDQKVLDWSYIHLSDTMLARSRLRKNKQQHKSMDCSITTMVSDESKVLQLEAKVVCASNTDYPIRMCVGCVRRERKRAERTKSKTDTLPEDIESERDRILLFNCSPMVNFSSGDAILPTRITCYCRHHNEKIGFRICFKMRDHTGNIVASGISPPIMITDDHKSLKQKKNNRKRSRDEINLDTPAPSRRGSLDDTKEPIPLLTPFQTPSGDDEEELQSTTPTSLEFINTINMTPATDLYQPLNIVDEPWPFNRRRKTISGYTSSDIKSVLEDFQTVVPQLDRLVPAQGPTYGGIEVTLLGSGFYRGLTCLFGEHPATTIYWNSNTLVCVLPPATQPGPVVVSFKEYPVVLEGQDVAIFTYYDASDQALLELALQVVGLKMTGKLHNAKHVAMQIVQGDDTNKTTTTASGQQQVLDALEIQEQCLDLTLQNSSGQTLLHLAVLLDNKILVRKLLSVQGVDKLQKLVDCQDKNDMTALQFAKSAEMVQILLGESHKKPLSRRNSFKSLMVHQFHNLTSTDGQSEAIMESDGLGLVEHQKIDLCLYLFWLPVFIVAVGLLYMFSINSSFFWISLPQHRSIFVA